MRLTSPLLFSLSLLVITLLATVLFVSFYVGSKPVGVVVFAILSMNAANLPLSYFAGKALYT